jgi:hypothetical protein
VKAKCYQAWLRGHRAEYAEGCLCEVCQAISAEDRQKIRTMWFRYMDEVRMSELPADLLLQRELELNPDKSNWGMF